VRKNYEYWHAVYHYLIYIYVLFFVTNILFRVRDNNIISHVLYKDIHKEEELIGDSIPYRRLIVFYAVFVIIHTSSATRGLVLPVKSLIIV
jgi:hypothetical protein